MEHSLLLFDDPDNLCFGCSPHNERGMRLVWRRVGDREVEAHYTADPAFNGAPGVVHGGIQAVLLDETLGVAIHHGCADPAEEGRHMVTADFELKYRRPVRSGVPLLLRGRVLRSEGRNYYVEGEILDQAGSELTRATARWVRIEPANDAGP